jgi:predicted Zn-dependent protease
MLITETEVRLVCGKLLSYVKADDAIVKVGSEMQSHLRFAANTFTTSGYSEDVSVMVTVWIRGRKGSASSNEIEDRSLQGIVDRAEQAAHLSPVDPEYLPTLGPQNYQPSGRFVDATANLSSEVRARTVSEIILTCQKEKVSGAGFHQVTASVSAAASKNGNFVPDRSTLVSMSMTSRTTEGQGSGYFLRNHFDITKLDTDRIARESIQRSLQSRNPRILDPGKYTVVLEPQAVADLLGFVSFMFDARTADEGRSPLSAPGGKTRVGERIFDERVNICSDPWHPELPDRCATREGIAAKKFFLVRGGVVENLTYNRFWAKKKEKEPSPGPINSILESSRTPASQNDMIRDTTKGLLVSRFWYLRSVDPRTALITGLTRDGVWYIENGKVQYPVRNFRFNQSLLQMLAPGNVDMIGSSERVSSSESLGSDSSFLPALKIKEFNFTSQSEAV